MSNDSDLEDSFNNDVSFDTFEKWGHDDPSAVHELLKALDEDLTGDSWDCEAHRVTFGYVVPSSREVTCDLTEVRFRVSEGTAAPCLYVEFTNQEGATSLHRRWVHPDLAEKGPQAVWEAFAGALHKEARSALFELYDVIHALAAAKNTDALKHEWPSHFHDFKGRAVGWDRTDRGSIENFLEVLQDRYGPEDD
ncbi:hypothetical protein [Salinibacter altiplanensis]|uniref:hypothetical protein n=1 Tax=Salinibacter altiplanensis TaxID=1803181 RepID=UPI000C9F3391|nr:hypothetical protein [Salinibacter altiplanensis]